MCRNYKRKEVGKWQHITQVCPDFNNETGTLPLWVAFILPFIGAATYLFYYYIARKKRAA
jgi:hypothetical protein